jgi:hypothetical protein
MSYLGAPVHPHTIYAHHTPAPACLPPEPQAAPTAAGAAAALKAKALEQATEAAQVCY